MKPYYSENGITIYNADCREVLRLLGSEMAVVSDPQYGIGFQVNAKRSRNSGLDFGKNRKDIERNPEWIPLQNEDKTPFEVGPFLRFSEIILWGANNYSAGLPNSRGWLVWDKLGDKQPCAFGDCELAWTSLDQSIRVWRQLWRGLVREGEENVANGSKLHPCQKPIALMRWCVGFTTSATILDPFMGSGTTLRAAKDLGRKAIGIEIEEKYCEIAAQRLSQGVLQFAEPEQRNERLAIQTHPPLL